MTWTPTDSCVMLMNTRKTNPTEAAGELNDLVSTLKVALIELRRIYQEAQTHDQMDPEMALDHEGVLERVNDLLTKPIT